MSTLNWPAAKLKIAVACLCGVFAGFLMMLSLPLASVHSAILLAVPLALLFLLFLLIQPKAVLFLLLFSRAFLDPVLNATRVAQDAMGLGALLNVGVLLLAGFLFLKNARAFFSNPASKLWLLYLLICLAAVAYSPAPGKAIRTFFVYSSYMAMMAIPFLAVREEREVKLWIKVILFSSVIPAILANVDMMQGGATFGKVGSRISGSFSHPNILGFYLFLQIALVFYIMKSGLFHLSSFKRTALGLYLANLVVLLLATKTRNAWLSCWLFFFIYGLIREKKLIFFCLAIPPALLLTPGVSERVGDLFIERGTGFESGLNSFDWRVELWSRSWSGIREHALFGHGVGSFEPFSANFLAYGEAAPAHNVYLQALFETGIFGLLAYVSIYLSTIVFLCKKIKRTPASLKAGYFLFIAYLVSQMFSLAGDNIQDYLAFNWYFWFLCGLILKSAAFHDPTTCLAQSAGHFSRSPKARRQVVG